MTPETKRKKIDDFIVRLSLMKDEAMRLRLISTSYKIKDATVQVGWDLENMIIRGEVNKKSTLGM